MSGDGPLVVRVSRSKQESSNKVDEGLDEGGMREGSLVFKTSEPNLMPQK